MRKIFDWLDRKFGIKAPHKNFMKRPVPDNIGYSYCFGGIAFVYFLLLGFSGMLLTLYYVPSEKEAYKSILMITEEISFGWLIRGLHKWSATLFIVFILLHTVRVFVSKAYRPPRELNWMAGVVGLIFALGSGFTGYLLPWDQKAYWATEVGTSMLGTLPFFGGHIKNLLRGGADVGGSTLIRFYSIHVIYMPVFISLLLWGHFHMVKRRGIAKNL
ncbi:MAG: cytochrome b N-terminal domain-containing protein [Nitrospirae bacterium]|nr:cytochrome b N-terminal domain-containing protein [Nitrospirota bacterium]